MDKYKRRENQQSTTETVHRFSTPYIAWPWCIAARMKRCEGAPPYGLWLFAHIFLCLIYSRFLSNLISSDSLSHTLTHCFWFVLAIAFQDFARVLSTVRRQCIRVPVSVIECNRSYKAERNHQRSSILRPIWQTFVFFCDAQQFFWWTNDNDQSTILRKRNAWDVGTLASSLALF